MRCAIDLFINPNHIELLNQKVFLHPLYRHVLLYYAKHQQINSFTLIFKDKLNEEFKNTILQDSWLSDLEINFQILTGEQPEKSILNIPYGDGQFLLIQCPADLSHLRRNIAEQIRTKAMTPVAKHINKRLSIPLSKLVARTNISPNQITFFAMLWSLAGALCLFSPTYYFFAFACFQINSVLDGTDGEVARMNLRFSTFGKKLDVYCDYLTSILLVFGEFVGYYLLNPTPKVLAGSLFGLISLLLIGLAWIIAIKLRLTPANFNDVEVICHKRLKQPTTTLEKILSIFLSISHRDFYILAVFIMSLFGLFSFIHFFLVLVCLSWLLLTFFSLKICGELKPIM